MQFSFYLVLVVVLIVIISCVIGATYRYIAQKATRDVFIALLLVLFSLCCFGLSLLITDRPTRFFFHELKFLTLAFLAPCSLIAYLDFTGKEQLLSRAGRFALCVIPAITAILAMTNGAHHFFRTDIYVVVHNKVSYVGATPSWWYWVHSIYSYLLYLCGVVVLGNSYFRMPRVYRDQTGILVATIAVAIVLGLASALRLFPDYGDISLVFGAVVCVAQYFAIVRYSRKRVTAKCRSLVLSEMSGYVLIYDHKEHLIDVGNASADEVCRALDAQATTNVAGENVRELRLPESGKCYSVSEKHLLDEKERLLGRVALLSDITDLKKAADELEHTATHDYLTGLPNRSAFHAELRGLEPKDLPAAIVYVCVPDMKLIVGIFGYEYGDRMIVQMAQDMKSLADGVVCARLNSDEIGVILKRAGAAEAEAFIDNAKHHVSTAGAGIRTELGYTLVSGTDTDAGRAFATMADTIRGDGTQHLRTLRPAFIAMLSGSLEKLRDDTGERSTRIAALCRRLAEKLALSAQDSERLEKLALFADIGLLSADPSLVQSIGNLTNEQWEEFKLHTVRGNGVALSMCETEDIARDILSHHERFDGCGYPSGLQGADIPITSRIYAAAEYFTDAPPARARAMLRAREGTQFDPAVVRALLELTEESMPGESSASV